MRPVKNPAVRRQDDLGLFPLLHQGKLKVSSLSRGEGYPQAMAVNSKGTRPPKEHCRGSDDRPEPCKQAALAEWTARQAGDLPSDLPP